MINTEQSILFIVIFSLGFDKRIFCMFTISIYKQVHINIGFYTQQIKLSMQKPIIHETPLIPIDIIIGDTILAVQVFPHWSINKLKCFITTEIPKLTFNDFEISFNKTLLRGNYQIAQIMQSFENPHNKIQVQVVKRESQTKFEDYYRQVMGRVMKINHVDEQPFLNPSYQRSLQILTPQNVNEKNQTNEQQIADIEPQENQIPRIFQFMRILGIYMFFNILKSHGSLFQVVLIGLVVVAYLLIERQRRANARNMQINANQNVNQRIHAPRRQQVNVRGGNRIKAEILLRVFKGTQILIVFFLSFFPNWELRGYRHQNADNLKRAKLLINEYRPGTYIIEGGHAQDANNTEQQLRESDQRKEQKIEREQQ